MISNTFLVKIGGSLTPHYVSPLFAAIKNSGAARSCRILIFPGGGDFADVVRKYQSETGLSDQTAHAMALAALDQNAWMIADICECSCLSSMEEIDRQQSGVFVIAPYRMLLDWAPFSGLSLNIDKLSSTSSALYFAHRLSAQFVIATDVDGIFDQDPRSSSSAALYAEISTGRLKAIKRGGALDETVPWLLERFQMQAIVVNGKYPERLLGILETPAATAMIGTRIVSG